VQLHSGTGRITASTTQQWPKQNILRIVVERTGSMWLPRPKTCGPLPGASVSSMAMQSDTLGSSRGSTNRNSHRPSESGFHVPREKNRWNAS
jgi:hypothetical protein